MNVPTRSDLVESIDAFLSRHPDIAESRFGRDVTGESGLVGRLRAGSEPTLRIAGKILDYMREKDRAAGHITSDTATAAVPSPGNAGQLTGAAA